MPVPLWLSSEGYIKKKRKDPVTQTAFGLLGRQAECEPNGLSEPDNTQLIAFHQRWSQILRGSLAHELAFSNSINRLFDLMGPQALNSSESAVWIQLSA
ncbi:hypothetical protein J5N97_022287 [Dioscorea zingiberensis]|uniref:Uncharacterized protein n=1 Tax=Dioscorea zingiberensis TaxID=325984 RepID=A0A9D5CAX8_9LILI|nr:hypothetical protein J5N97_022287 [Dioscorea zingiberensis]